MIPLGEMESKEQGHALARSLEMCRECSKLGPRGILDTLDKSTEGFLVALEGWSGP